MRAFLLSVLPGREVQKTQEGQGRQEEPQSERAPKQVEKPDHKALLDRQDARNHEPESQVAEAAKSRETADRLAEKIEQLRTEATKEREGYELGLAGARNVTAARALLAEHGGTARPS
ncbi:hypothetical protein ACTQ2Q_00070 [Atopobiaceae bacterium LCP21S3_F11]